MSHSNEAPKGHTGCPKSMDIKNEAPKGHIGCPKSMDRKNEAPKGHTGCPKNMDRKNEMRLEFDSRSCNEGFVRVAVAAFLTQLNPTLEEVADVKTALSEAVTNSVIHGYEGDVQKITIICYIVEQEIFVEVADKGRGIENIEKAMEPLFTTKPDSERSGMGFAFMEAFMDEVKVKSAVGEGTTVFMRKKIGQAYNKFDQ